MIEQQAGDPQVETGSGVEPPFYPLGIRKLALMFTATFGLYSIHWCYENWWRIRTRQGAKFSPKTRAFLSPIYIYGLFREIGRAADQERVATAFSPVGAAGLYVAGIVASRLLVDEVVLLSLVPLYLPIHAAQLLANRLNQARAPEADRNESLSIGNKVIVLIGGLVFLSAVWSTLEAVQARLAAP